MDKYRSLKNYDVVIVGGGMAGFGAAMGSARAGAKTLLLEASGVLGGLAVNGLVNPFMKFDYQGESLVGGAFRELIEKLKKDNAYMGRAFDYESLKYHLVEMLEQENVDILFYHQVIDVERKGRIIKRLKTFSGGRTYNIRGKVYLDCTGDAILGKLAGLTLFKGDRNGKNQALTQMFVLEGVNLEKTMEYVRNHPDDFFSWVNTQQEGIATSVAGFFGLIKKAEEDGYDLPRDHFFFIKLPKGNAVVVNTGHILISDANDPLAVSAAQKEGLKQTRILTDFARNYLPGFEKAFLNKSATQVGIRESARIKGKYIFKQEDVENNARFKDAVVRAIYGVDIHENKEEESKKEVELNYSNYYEIPARSLIAAEVDNMLMAGRNLSADFGGQSAVRIMPTCCGMGQGAGVMGALVVKGNFTPEQLKINELKRELIRQGVNVSEVKSDEKVCDIK